MGDVVGGHGGDEVGRCEGGSGTFGWYRGGRASGGGRGDLEEDGEGGWFGGAGEDGRGGRNSVEVERRGVGECWREEEREDEVYEMVESHFVCLASVVLI